MSPRTGAILILLIASLLYCVAIGERDFWAPDEGDFALIAQELDNDIVVPHLNGEPYGEKPPLFYYLTFLAVKSLPFLKAETSMRIPSAFCATAFTLLFYYLLLPFFPLKRVLAASLILLSLPLYYWQARYLQVDMVFATLVSSSLLTLFSFIAGGRPLFLYLGAVFLGLSFLVKGPLALALVLPPAFLFTFTKDGRQLFPVRRLIVCFCIIAILVLPWYVAIYIKEGYAFLYENIIRQNFTRFFDAWSHRRPFYYYFTTLPLDAFPWIVFFPVGLVRGIRAYRTDRNLFFFVLWFLWIFFFLSLSSGKISKYMLPLLPPLSLLCADVFYDERSTYRTAATIFLAVIFGAFGIALLIYKPAAYEMFHSQALAIAVISLIVSALLCVITITKRIGLIFPVLLLYLVTLFTVANMKIFPVMNGFKSPRPLAEAMKPYLSEGSPWVYYGSIRGVYVYYAGKQAVHVDEHDTDSLFLLSLTEKRFYLLTRARDLAEVRDTLQNVDIIFERRIGDTPMTFVRYTAPSENGP